MSTTYHDKSVFATTLARIVKALAIVWLFGMGALIFAPNANAHEEPSVVDKTTRVISESAETVSQKSSEAWDKTKSTTESAVNYTSEKSSEAWDATKRGADKAWETTKDAAVTVADYTKETVQLVKDGAGPENSNEISVEDKSF